MSLSPVLCEPARVLGLSLSLVVPAYTADVARLRKASAL